MILSGASELVFVAGALFAVGLASLIAKSHLIKMVMGIEFLGKAVSLIFILSGYLSGDVGASQAVVFTLIAIEAVVAGIALTLVILIKRVWKTFDNATMSRLLQGGDS
jgi:NADH:ubiquinone oxidoreductase subunit K